MIEIKRYAVLLGLTFRRVIALEPPGAKAEGDFRVTLLGTGIPFPQPNRLGPATLVEAGTQKPLFDAERGATIWLFQLIIVWLSGWLGGFWARRTAPFHAIGPSGTKALMSNLKVAYAANLRIRIAD